ncbi:MAG: hypothetical protein HYV09_11180 [Deltaproteobacteria bacterium]|nr:hypothetical protein [Deltaproteobacteria bacterium]
MRARSLVFAVALAVFALPSSIGCVSGGRPGPDVYGYRVAAARVDPVVLDRAPRVYYRGAWARFVDGTWYYPTESGWVAFVEVPPELQRQHDAMHTEQPPTQALMPRGPTTQQFPIGGGPVAPPPPRVR